MFTDPQYDASVQNREEQKQVMFEKLLSFDFQKRHGDQLFNTSVGNL